MKSIELLAATGYIHKGIIDSEEFYEDFKRFSHFARILKKYTISKKINLRLAINHLIIIFNVFDAKIAREILFSTNDVETWPALRALLLYISRLPSPHNSDTEPVDLYLTKQLQCQFHE